MSQPTEITDRTGGTPVRLRHGRWSLELRGDEVADLAYDGVLLLRAVRPVVRDRDWKTVPVRVLAQQETASQADGTATAVSSLQFDADGISYRGTVTVTLDSGGVEADSFLIDFHGEALTDFERNRIGLVVLHPAAVAGQAVEVRHSDGRVEAGRWPRQISPHQPFRDVTGFEWRESGVTATVTLSGDVFETEDQRNWTDASFKTYSTPLSLPFPVRVSAGDSCVQQLRLTARGAATGRARLFDARPVEHSVAVSDTEIGTLPPISLGANLYPPPADLPNRQVPYETVLAELVGPEHWWPALIQAATAQADAFGADLDIRLVTADVAEVRRAFSILPLDRVRRLAAFDPSTHITTAVLWEALGRGAGESGFTGELVAGSRAHFTELNRGFDQLPFDAPALTFSLTPQMHATEIPHVVDSLATQATVAENAIRLAGPRPVHVGPITLKPRFNAVATSGPTDPAIAAERAIDPLLSADFAAAWTLGSAAALAPTGVASVCYFETVGARGIISADGPRRPVAEVLDVLASLRGRPLLDVSASPGVAALAVGSTTGDVALLVANLTAAPRTVRVSWPLGRSLTLELGPWAVSIQPGTTN